MCWAHSSSRRARSRSAMTFSTRATAKQVPRASTSDLRIAPADVRGTCLLAGAFFLISASPLAAQEVVAAIQVHGNTITAADEIIRASGISVGDRVSDTLL